METVLPTPQIATLRRNVEALVAILDPAALPAAERALAVILERQAERSEADEAERAA